MTRTVVADFGCHVGECPIWHPAEGVVYWIDIPPGRVFRYDPADETAEQIIEGPAVRAITAERSGGLLVFEEAGAVYHWTDGEVEPVSVDLPYRDGFRFNDVTPDPRGRVFCGVMATEDRPGSLYRLDPDRSMHQVLDDVAFPNGLGFSPEGDRFYFTDTRQNVIYAFDYDAQSGDATNRRVFADTATAEGIPDGLAVDAAGGVWSTRWDGGRLVRYGRGGELAAQVDLPARKVTNVAFGGPGGADAYVTTALASSTESIGTKAEEGEGAGALFRLDLGVDGPPAPSSDLAP